MKGDHLRRMGYSFLGLLAGNIALLLLFLFYALRTGMVLHSQLKFQFWSQIEAFFVFTLFSIVGWLVVGVPAVSILSSQSTARLPQLALLPIGALLGPLALLVIFVLLGRGRITAGIFTETGALWLYAAIISTIAFSVHCLLVRRYVRSMQSDTG